MPLALKHGFPSLAQSVINNRCRRDQSRGRTLPLWPGRLKLDFQLSRCCHRSIGSIERAISRGRVGPRDETCSDNRPFRGLGFERFRFVPMRLSSVPWRRNQGVGRNTQMAAGCADLARTASSRRSISGTKSEVRAPETVGMRAIRRYVVSFTSKISGKPAPQLT